MWSFPWNPSATILPSLTASDLRFRNLACYVTDSQSLEVPDPFSALRDTIRRAVEGGVDWIQIREKHREANELLALTRDAVRVAGEEGGNTRVIVNDRADVAIAGGAGGVHLGGNSASAKDVASWLRRFESAADFLIGVSCHSVHDVRHAEEEGADYAFFGPIFDTPLKRVYGPPVGLAMLREACSSRIPVIAIGGIDSGGIVACLEAGAAGIAAIRMFQQQSADQVRETVEKIHNAAR